MRLEVEKALDENDKLEELQKKSDDLNAMGVDFCIQTQPVRPRWKCCCIL